MDFIFALALAATTAWLISMVGGGAIERAVTALALLVGGWRAEPWPRGVQEEDRDRPWGSTQRSIGLGTPPDDLARPVPASRVIARTRPR